MARLNPTLQYWMEVWAKHERFRIGPLGYPSSTAESKAYEMHLTDKGSRKRTAAGKQTKAFRPRVPDYWPNKTEVDIFNRVGEVVKHQLDGTERSAVMLRWLTEQPEKVCAIALGLSGPDEYRAMWERVTRKIGRLLDITGKKRVCNAREIVL